MYVIYSIPSGGNTNTNAIHAIHMIQIVKAEWQASLFMRKYATDTMQKMNQNFVYNPLDPDNADDAVFRDAEDVGRRCTAQVKYTLGYSSSNSRVLNLYRIDDVVERGWMWNGGVKRVASIELVFSYAECAYEQENETTFVSMPVLKTPAPCSVTSLQSASSTASITATTSVHDSNPLARSTRQRLHAELSQVIDVRRRPYESMKESDELVRKTVIPAPPPIPHKLQLRKLNVNGNHNRKLKFRFLHDETCVTTEHGSRYFSDILQLSKMLLQTVPKTNNSNESSSVFTERYGSLANDDRQEHNDHDNVDMDDVKVDSDDGQQILRQCLTRSTYEMIMNPSENSDSVESIALNTVDDNEYLLQLNDRQELCESNGRLYIYDRLV